MAACRLVYFQTSLFLFCVPDEGEGDHDSGDGHEESKATKKEISPRECTKGNSFPHGI